MEGDYDGHKWSHGHTIGSAWGDLDNDGEFDLFVGNFSHPPKHQDRPRFYRNTGQRGGYAFEDRSDDAGLAWQESYASPALGDMDNDGDLDLYFTTVYAVGSHKIRNYPVLYRNDGDWRFTDVTEASGLAQLPPTYQAAWADFDNDGDLDLATAGKLFVNRGENGHWLKILLQGDSRSVNRSAIGAQVRLRAGPLTVARQVEAGSGEGNQHPAVLHFGLGAWQAAVTLDITWPDGATRQLQNVQPDRAGQIQK